MRKIGLFLVLSFLLSLSLLIRSYAYDQTIDYFNIDDQEPISELSYNVDNQEFLTNVQANESDGKYVLASDSDFVWITSTKDHPVEFMWYYIGTDDYVIIPHTIQGKEVISCKGMFYGTSVKGVACDNKKIKSMFYMFHKNTADSLDLSRLDTSNVTDMYGMFEDCHAKSIDLSSFKTSNVESMENMFKGCQATSLDLSSFDTKSVTTMKSMFKESQATSIKLSSFNTCAVTNMLGMFKACAVKSLDLKSFDTKNVNIMSSMFEDCLATSIDLSSFDTSNVSSMFNMFSASRVKNLDVSSFNTSRVFYMDNMFAYLYWESEARSLDLSSFKTSNVESMYSMFRNGNVTSIDLSSFDTSGVRDMGWMFAGCKAKSLDLSSFNTHYVFDMSRMFYDYKGKSLDLSSFDTSLVENMSYMFAGCQATILDLSSFNTSRAWFIENMFSGCAATTGYARNLGEANKFTYLDGTPEKLVFVVKGASTEKPKTEVEEPAATSLKLISTNPKDKASIFNIREAILTFGQDIDFKFDSSKSIYIKDYDTDNTIISINKSNYTDYNIKASDSSFTISLDDSLLEAGKYYLLIDEGLIFSKDKKNTYGGINDKNGLTFTKYSVKDIELDLTYQVANNTLTVNCTALDLIDGYLPLGNVSLYINDKLIETMTFSSHTIKFNLENPAYEGKIKVTYEKASGADIDTDYYNIESAEINYVMIETSPTPSSDLSPSPSLDKTDKEASRLKPLYFILIGIVGLAIIGLVIFFVIKKIKGKN